MVFMTWHSCRRLLPAARRPADELRRQRLRAIHETAGSRVLNYNDTISRMPDELLLVILSLLPIKYAVVTSSLSTRWMFLWCELMLLNFDGRETLSHIEANINQVNNVIRNYNRPRVQEFRIRFKLYHQYARVINEWLMFAVIKKVEILEMDFRDESHMTLDDNCYYIYHNYIFPSVLSKELDFIKKLILKNVNVTQEILQELLVYSPYLETIIIHGSQHLKHICVGGRALNLKHFEIVNCLSMESIDISDFDLVSFTFHGRPIYLRLRNLAKLRELNMGQQFVSENNVLGQISGFGFTSSLIILSFRIHSLTKDFKLDSLPVLPNVKKLTLTVGAHKDVSLLEFASLVNACPNLETFTVKVLWYSPFRRNRVARSVDTCYPHQRLKLLQFLGYYGRISDFELAACIITNVGSLKKVVIDARCQAWMVDKKGNEFFKKQDRIARRNIKSQIVPIMPQGVDLVVL